MYNIQATFTEIFKNYLITESTAYSLYYLIFQEERSIYCQCVLRTSGRQRMINAYLTCSQWIEVICRNFTHLITVFFQDITNLVEQRLLKGLLFPLFLLPIGF